MIVNSKKLNMCDGMLVYGWVKRKLVMRFVVDYLVFDSEKYNDKVIYK